MNIRDKIKSTRVCSPVGKIFFAGMIIILSGLCSACDDDDDVMTEKEKTQTLLMYMPWSGNLTSYFLVNIKDMGKAIQTGILKHERVLVFLATSRNRASMFELVYNERGDTCIRKPLKSYENHPCTTAEGIASLLEDMKSFAPADRYSMTIGGHGMGWLFVNKSRSYPLSADTKRTEPFYHWEYTEGPLTRYFGGTSSDTQTNISTLAEGISSAGLHMEYILFDDCYMSCVEVAYELRHVTDHLIASTSEIMAKGMPYEEMGAHLVGQIDYEAICESFHTFYSSYSTPCGTIAVTRTGELEPLAGIMKEINTRFTFDQSLADSLQELDGYTPCMFYDYGDYVARLCPDTAMLNRFNTQLTRTVIHHRHTPYYYSAISGRKEKINRFSGITCSDPSTHRLTQQKDSTSWYKATH